MTTLVIELTCGWYSWIYDTCEGLAYVASTATIRVCDLSAVKVTRPPEPER